MAPVCYIYIKQFNIKVMGTHYKGTRTQVQALNAFIALSRAAESLHASLDRPLEEAGLSVSQFGTLDALHHLGPLCQCEISQKLLRSGGNMVMVLDNLEKRGLVRRVRDQKDRRRVPVHLTEKGRRLLQAVFPRHLSRIMSLMAELTDSEKEDLRRLCRKLGLQAGRASRMDKEERS